MPCLLCMDNPGKTYCDRYVSNGVGVPLIEARAIITDGTCCSACADAVPLQHFVWALSEERDVMHQELRDVNATMALLVERLEERGLLGPHIEVASRVYDYAQGIDPVKVTLQRSESDEPLADEYDPIDVTEDTPTFWDLVAKEG